MHLGLAGTMVLQEVDPPRLLPPPPQIHHQWWLALHPTRDPPQSHQPLQGLPEGSLSGELAVQEPAVAVVAVGEHQNSGYLVLVISAGLWWPDGNISCCP